MIRVRALSHRYPQADGYALRDISLDIAEGAAIGLLGPNGAGKTTLMSLLTGLQECRQGEITFDGTPFSRLSRKARHQISLVPQDFAFYPLLSVRDNLSFFASLYGRKDRAYLSSLIERCGLSPHAAKQARHLSGGLKRRLNFAIGLVNRPRVVFLDEITVGIDPQSRRFILESVAELNRSGVTIVYTSHYLQEIELLCRDLVLLDNGRCVYQGALADILRRHGGRLLLHTEPPLSPADAAAFAATPAAGGGVAIDSRQPENVLAALAAKNYRISACRFGFSSLEDFYLDFLDGKTGGTNTTEGEG